MFKFIALFAASTVSAGTSLADLEGSTAPAASVAQTNILTGDFLTGFESGIFLREHDDQIQEYNCPKAEVNIEEFKKVKEMLPAVTTMVSVMMKDEPDMKNMLESFTVFVQHLDELIGVFDPMYNGGDFCAGLTFGSAGSNLLYKMASVIIHANLKNVKKNSKA